MILRRTLSAALTALAGLVAGSCSTAPAAAPDPSPRVVETTVLGPFTGVGAALHPDNVSPNRVLYYGTDLGFSYRHGGQIRFLFGDTMVDEKGARAAPGGDPMYDDIFATIDLAEWPDPGAITADTIPPLKLAQVPGTERLWGIDPGHVMDGLKTPEAGFSNGQREFAILILTKPQGCVSDADCGPQLSCDPRIGYVGVPWDQQAGLTLGCREGTPDCLADTMRDAAGNPIEGSGFCVDTSSSVWSDTPAGHVPAVALWQRIGLRDLQQPHRYAPIADWLTSKFVNATTRTVARFDPAAGTRDQDYRPATHAGPSSRVLVWGRPGFVGLNARNRPMNLYLAYADLPRAPEFDWTLRFYSGSGPDGTPKFSPNERDAVGLDLDDRTPGRQPTEPIDVVQHMSIAWSGHLDKWIMFYGGGIDVTPIPAIGLDDCGLLEVFMRDHCNEVVVGQGAVHMRTADDPWGPWSAPQVVIAGGDPTAPGSGQYGPGGMLYHPQCNHPDCAPHSPIAVFHEQGYGWFYGANIIDAWLQPAGRGLDVLWNASTWDPYRVILLRTRIVPP